MAGLPVLDSIELSREFFVSLGAPGLLAVAFLEFFLLPVPPDLVLVPLTVVRPELGPLYAAVATVGSVSAGVIGYTVGRKGGRPVLESRFSAARVEQSEAYVEKYGFTVLTFGAFAPIPEGYELLSVAAGVSDLRLRSYLLASILGRGGRYLLEALLVVVVGDAARSLTEVELYTAVGVVSLLAVCGYLLRDWWLPASWLESR